MSEEKEHAKKKHHGGGHGAHGGGGHEEHEGAPEWLISFADNVTLMMGFFVILLAMNLKPAASGAGDSKQPGHAEPSVEALDTAIAIREAFNNPVDLGSTDPNDWPLVQRLRQRTGESAATQKGKKGREHDVQSVRPGRYYTLGAAIGFAEGQSDLTADGLAEIVHVAEQLTGHNMILDVRGHVSAAEAFGRPDRGMELSFRRAVTVAKSLSEHGIGWEQMRLTACADNDRITTPAYEREAHESNQRVEVVVTDRIKQSLDRPEENEASPAPSTP